MCGLAGIVDARPERSEDALRAAVAEMAATLRHRGPDDCGVFVDAAAGVALGHRRLSIIDLSPAGHQPMHSADGRYTIVYNGEVYNHPELRAELERSGRRFRGHSDTETILEAWAAWGARRTLARLNGMFAFAVFDRRERALTLVRDRMGIKPLYWGRQGESLLFGSELKALRAHPGFAAEIDRGALLAFLRHNYVPAPWSIYRGIFKLLPGQRLTWRAGQEPEIERYWDLRQVARAGLAQRSDVGDEEATRELETLLRNAVELRMLADVPLGAFLSGGIDSSTVVALMQAQSSRPVRTFSIGFREPGYDEAPHARAVARHLGTDHTELYVESQHAREIIPRLPEWFDEPFSDPSQIPTYLVSELTRRHVTVALSGDGGDELFAGYDRYFRARRLRARLAPLPATARHAGAVALRAAAALAGGGLPAALAARKLGYRARKLAVLLAAREPEDLYRSLISRWDDPEELAPGAAEAHAPCWDGGDVAFLPDAVERMQLLDALSYLPDDILTKVDRASMAESLEARVPILDHRVVELSWRLPARFKIRDGEGKWLLRRVLERHVPRGLVERPKMGFGVPVGAWLRGPLRDWAESLLDERRLRDEGFLSPQAVRCIWREHASGRADWAYALWDVLMFQAWLAAQGGRHASAGARVARPAASGS